MRVALREVAPADLPTLFEHQRDPLAHGRVPAARTLGRRDRRRGAGRVPARRTRRPLYAGVASRNAGSLRVLEKCRFAACGAEGDLVTPRP